MLPEDIEIAAEDVQHAHAQLITNGFTRDEAIKLAGLVLMHAERRTTR